MPKRITGKHLKKLWGISAEHTLYRRDGSWYHQLTSFPGALCDAEGYVLFPTGRAFHNCPSLQIKQDVHCPGGIQQIAGYVRCDSQVANDINPPSQPKRVLQHVSRVIRDTAISSELKLLYDHFCQLCGTRLMFYGRRYSEAHHIRPLGAPHDGSDTRDNLLCVCPNCHVLLDYAAVPIQLDALKHLRHPISAANVEYHNLLHRKAFSGVTTAFQMESAISNFGLKRTNLGGDTRD